MTTESTVFGRIHAWETLLLAWDRVEENEGGAGVDGVTLDDFELRLEEELRTLQRDIRDRLYKPQPLLAASMPKADGGRRPLAIPTVRDRVAQSAAAVVITPILEREFEASSFGFRRRRSVPHAVAEVRRHYDEGYRWVVDADIDTFFDDVEHSLLLARLKETIPDPDLLALVQAWLTAPLQQGGQLVERSRGLPQGAPVSPVLANLYLDRFDEALAARGYRLVRFADDFLILCRERPAAEAALELTENLLGQLRLSLDPDKTRITHFDHGFRYLGHLFVRSLVVPSPNRLQPRPVPETSAPSVPKPAAPAPTRRLRGVRSVAEDTALSRALIEALGEAGRESLVLPEANAVEALAERPARETERPSTSAPVASPAPVDEARGSLLPAGAGLRGADRGPDLAEVAVKRTKRPVSPFRRTLYIQQQGAVLARTEERLVVKKDGEVLLEVPAAKVDQVFVFGRCSITTPAMTFCLQQEIPVVLLSSRGQYYGLIDSPLADRVTLHRQQFARAADSAFSVATARAIVLGKLSNSRVLLQRHQRRKGLEPLRAAIADLDTAMTRVPDAKTVEEIQGYEGYGAARYFEAFSHLLQQNLGFTRRVRRPPTDPVNSLLSLGYTLCFYNLYGLIRGRGLHPSVGYLHGMRDKHPALASDLVEEFRAPIVDSLVLYLLNSRIFTAEHVASPARSWHAHFTS